MSDAAAGPAFRAAAYDGDRPEVRALVPAGARRVLDLGCHRGALGAALRTGGREVVGVERDPDAAAVARTRLDAVVERDLEVLLRSGAAAREALGCGFDALVAADVLEHVREPWRVLVSAVALLAPGATVVVSLPNVRHWTTFHALLVRGSWPREAAGLFDATHLRWFTLADAWALLDDAGLEVGTVVRVPAVRPGRRSRLDRLPLPPGVRSLATLQHVLAARVPGDAAGRMTPT